MKVFNINNEVKKTNIVSIGNNINYKVSCYFIEKYDDIRIYDNISYSFYFILKGKGYYEDINWKEGDIFDSSFSRNGIQICAIEDSIILSINNNPFLESLGLKPYKNMFKTKIIDIFNENIDRFMKKIIVEPSKKIHLTLKKNILIPIFFNEKSYIIENDLKIKKGEIYICEEDTKFLIINESDKKILFLIL